MLAYSAPLWLTTDLNKGEKKNTNYETQTS